MALIQCKTCGKDISDKAKTCPNCGTEVINEEGSEEIKHLTCKECGTEIPEGSEVCPNCGCPVEEETGEEESVQKVEISSVNLPKMKSNTKKGVIIGVVVVVLAVVCILVGMAIHNKKAADEAVRISEEYGANLSAASLTMLMGSSQAEDAGNLIRNVWYNSIYEERDSETDKYTRPNGYFYDDFNDALGELFSDSTFKSKISSIQENQKTVEELMKALKNPPEEYKEAYEAIRDYYDAYLSLTNLAVNPTGSLQTYTSSFRDADNAVLNAYNTMKLYTE